ncbi:YggS family pyridoxal phosphate-dependent enzyme [Faecalitalea cylindroides]|jgi:pyridoxal phosphate enzyme (YggS family)|uniref:Pyridoxal phosphate homeostasis protein n=2 Tax=Faecalitalea cylindroides TaxID=39483 RepID=A0AAW6FQ01_9FIRM|nr:YggS family pyridoxal phosphate-dependent enzyme [Faecalitalea cylindroides]ERK41966.1 pyridoxal phosphate enzyme, YggS family [[Eubacterium] cylindroides ATCC 27803] [Faecalitalea cylindroides ATCC 27803]MBM6653017.1 YggS family pyridoxal phosphate-dependent enzyme [Faecalitalea cylindroides]MDC0827384.1 YggS family pyridoxal phosphate-dependent enzyme [Faecalitalea cylindroides]MEE1448137.1 YggS family pyridoxal phosphate-dependent enzyme [Faecalitalea cylindroides]OUN61776.1 YggS family 
MNKEMINKLKNMNVNIVAVSKYHTKEEIDAVAKEGLITFGENRVQEFLEKYDPKYKWHIIGHLQTNKVKYIIGKVEMIESLDSIKLAKEIEKQAAKHDVIQNVLVQIKISKDELKTGLPIEETDSFLKEVSTYPHIKLKGFMCVASHTDNIQLIEEEFSMMNDLYKNYKDLYQLDTLSMGMSNDYELAIKHGSNTVRIGSAIFGARN